MSTDIKLPKDWKWTKLGDTCEIVSGNTPKGIENISNTGSCQFYKVSDMNSPGNEVKMSVSNYNLTTEEVKKLKLKTFPKGTVIFPKRGGAILTNKKRILSNPASFDLNLMGILPNENVEADFLFYWMQKLDLGKICDGSNILQINNKNIVPLDFPLPPLSTQQSIVSKIEELFSELDNGIANLKTAQQQLNTYRQSVLKWAFEGKLTNKNVKEGELPEHWFLIPMKKIAKFIDYRGRTPKKTNSGIPLITAKNVKMGFINDEPREYISPDDYEVFMTRGIPKINDVLFSTEAPMGNVALLHTKNKIALAQRLITFQCYDIILPAFLKYSIMNPKFQEILNQKGTGTTVKGIKAATLKELEIPVPSLKEQEIIIQEIESRLSVADKMEESITQSLQQAEALRQSILKKAFEGKLI